MLAMMSHPQREFTAYLWAEQALGWEPGRSLHVDVLMLCSASPGGWEIQELTLTDSHFTAARMFQSRPAGLSPALSAPSQSTTLPDVRNLHNSNSPFKCRIKDVRIYSCYSCRHARLPAPIMQIAALLSTCSPYTVDLERYYQTENEDENPFICSQPRENGMRYCRSIPTRREEGLECTLDYYSYNDTTNTSCVNWNQYYTNCSAGEHNPFKGAINFDNIGYAWIAIFQVSWHGNHPVGQGLCLPMCYGAV